MFSFGSKNKREIFWWEPRWAHLPRLWRGNEFLFYSRFVVHAAVVAFVLFGCALAVHIVFQIGFPWLARAELGVSLFTSASTS